MGPKLLVGARAAYLRRRILAYLFFRSSWKAITSIKGEQMARYYGYYSNVARGKRKKAAADDKIPCILEPELTDKTFRKNWARLIQKIYEVDPLICSKCQGQMRVIAFIHDEDVIRKILKHLGLWDVKRILPPRAHAPTLDGFPLYDEPPAPSADDYLTDPDYPVDAYF